MKKVMHYNPGLPHQVDHAEAFKASGFGITTDPAAAADVHVISGPNYALRNWKKHDRVLMIDRAWWDDPNSVSIGWLQPGGSRKFAHGTAPRAHPEPEPWKVRECSCLILADYGQNISEVAYQASRRFTSLHTRLHPANATQRHQVTLSHQLRLHDVVICHAGTSGFEAIMQGVPTICTAPESELMPVSSPSIDSLLYRGNRTKWLHEMAYKQFTLAEIADGTAWNLLKDVI